ncbi:DNA polymerase-3 subunit delta [Bacillus mesophilus]|uniref:DNA polymerase III subunit delta n=1 Tax=Bacillus mesophilus TaxID=1808955 RepID=A0A6M0Q5X5_9BACI|nr:DNA polymerase III subunit delta [Bacillus mesophilus]MBM7660770.1 DNA polymerase-3 subunit delta [Bacillus mesophilus]NEY71683.1 DNA polymerase III subunit delta [Bacillus mesophilus]
MNIDIHKKIKAKNFAPLYLLYGKETYFIDETIQLLIKHVLNDEERDFNLSVYDLEESPIDLAIEDAQTLPFFGDKRVVIVKNAFFLTGLKEKTKIDHNIQLLEEYIHSPSPTAIFILVVDAEKLDERKKITKLFKKEASLFEATMSDEKSLISWMQSEVKHLQVNITDDAVGLLLQYVRGTVTLLVQELNKMAMYVGPGGTITEDIVKLLSSRTIEDNIFELIDCVLSRKVSRALEIYHDLLKLNEEPIKILSLLSSQFRLLYQVKDLSKRGYSQQQIANHIKIHPYRVKLASQKATHYSNEYLLKSLDELAEMDYQIKSGQYEKKLALELFILKQVQ